MPSTASASSRSRSSKSDQRPISTGDSRSNAHRRAKFASKKASELFARLNANSFVTLVLQAAQVALEEKIILQAIEDAKEDGDVTPIDTKEITEDPVDRALTKNGISTTDRSTMQSVIVGVGETDFSSEAKRLEARKVLGMAKPVDTTSPYLLLDVRDDDAFKKCHIISGKGKVISIRGTGTHNSFLCPLALNYPAPMLARMFNYETRELVGYKNLPGKLIIFYDDLERDSPRVASTFYERGYDNVYVISGGLKSLNRAYPEGLITGTLPIQVLRSSPETTRKTGRQSHSSSVMARSSSTPSIAKMTAYRRNSRNSDAKHDHSKWNPFDANGQLKENFDDEELGLLRQKLEHNLLPRMKKNTLGKATVSSKAQNAKDSSQHHAKSRLPPKGAKPWY